MKLNETLILKIVIGLAIVLIIAIILGNPNVLRKDKAEQDSSEAEKAINMAAEVKISADAQPSEALITAGGTLAGAGIGGILGGVTAGTGAAVGAVSGAGIGLAYIIWRKGKEVKVPEGTQMVVVLEQPFNVTK